MWTPYEQIRGHRADFRVRYLLYDQAEGGRRLPPRQGYRCDFAYAEDGEEGMQLYGIHPEFEDGKGEILMDGTAPVPTEGTARMWVLFPEMRRSVHAKRIRPGVRGFFMEGPRRLGEVEVLDVIDLAENAERIGD
ncbi:hypothetical protein CDO73_10420 [Saccharibacillus sp. O23]|uniref:hypothetical protein n=1 Tax=Saccharibacillus sp. O23 TaxID=2009338 RepID=UPI000B4E57A6|nr:hypothetical protein [Saccharibacillus sp. O23]OWR30331.1 hypothetical protein CDO73_10420 [Saccharibacillus sp. O23]